MGSTGTASMTVDYGQRLLPTVLEELAVSDPSHVIGIIADSPSLPLTFTSITALQISKAVDYMANYLDKHLGRVPVGQFLPIAFIGLQDYRYFVMMIAAMKVSRPLLIPSPRNGIPNTLSLLESTGIKQIFYSSTSSGKVETHVKELVAAIPGFTIHHIPTIAEMITIPSLSYPYDKTWSLAKNDPVLIVHTSGSTGRPKPITLLNAWLCRIDTDILTPTVPGRTLSNLRLLREKKLCYLGTTFFHMSGIGLGLTSLFQKSTVVFGPADELPSPKIACDIAKSLKLAGIMGGPSLIDGIFSTHGVELKPYLQELEHVNWLGGPLATSTGDFIIKNTNAIMWQIFGSTEMGWLPLLVSPRSHWQYLEFHPTIGPTLEPISPGSELHEIVIHRHPDPALSWSRPIFVIFPENEEYRSRDLVRRCADPGFENLWIFVGRVDDMMVLSSGYKVNPLDIEVALQGHSQLNGCLVFGTGYSRCGLLLEPKIFEQYGEDLLEMVWESVEVANMSVPEHARIDRQFVVIADRERPFVRAAKGTIIRALTINMYAEEIEKVYTKEGIKHLAGSY